MNYGIVPNVRPCPKKPFWAAALEGRAFFLKRKLFFSGIELNLQNTFHEIFLLLLQIFARLG